MLYVVIPVIITVRTKTFGDNLHGVFGSNVNINRFVLNTSVSIILLTSPIAISVYGPRVAVLGNNGSIVR